MTDLFDFAKGDKPDDSGSRRDRQGEPDVLTVTELTRKIRTLLELKIGEVWVEGEISNLRRQASGHQYFTLKDSGAQVACVMFRNDARKLAAPLEDGARVQLFGEVSVYEPRGQHQIIVRVVQEKGLGALQARFEALKRQLAAEGLFDEGAKAPIPKFPRTVCLVTSPTGAALQDMLNILQRRAPWLRILLYPVRVQGDGAAREIAAALNHLASADMHLPVIDTVVVGRGGGSLEDLWPFNEEVVARAIHSLPIPVVSAVGHEIDFTIADFTADLRAPTPSAAAELIAPDQAELHSRLDSMAGTLNARAERTLERWSERLDYLGRGALLREPERALAERDQEIDWKTDELYTAARSALGESEEAVAELRHRLALNHPTRTLEAAAAQFDLLASGLHRAAEGSLASHAERVATSAAALKNLGPDAVLARGFSLTLNEGGELVRSVAELAPGDTLRTKLSDGEVRSTVS